MFSNMGFIFNWFGRVLFFAFVGTLAIGFGTVLVRTALPPQWTSCPDFDFECAICFVVGLCGCLSHRCQSALELLLHAR